MAQADPTMTAAAPAEGGLPITAQQASRYAGWLRAAYDAARAYNGTEAAMNAVIGSLNAMDDFTRAAAADHGYHPALEEAFARAGMIKPVIARPVQSTGNGMDHTHKACDDEKGKCLSLGPHECHPPA